MVMVPSAIHHVTLDRLVTFPVSPQVTGIAVLTYLRQLGNQTLIRSLTSPYTLREQFSSKPLYVVFISQK